MCIYTLSVGRENWQLHSLMMPYTLMNTGMVKGMVGGGAGRAELKMGEGRGLLFLL